MRNALAVCALWLVVCSPAHAGFCEDMFALWSRRVPQLLGVEGTPDDLMFTLHSWSRDRNSTFQGEAALSTLTTGVGRALVSYARDRRRIPVGRRDVGFQSTMRQIIFELVNNASYHGNQGARDKQVTLRLKGEGDRVTIEITDQSGKYFDVAPLLREMSETEVAEAYMQAAEGGKLGLNLVLQGAMNKYKFTVRSEAVTDRGRTTGTRVFIDIDLRQAFP